MSEGVKQRANSFTQYVRPNISTEMSTDQMRNVIRYPIQIMQSIEFNNVHLSDQLKSFEGIDPQNQFRPHYSNDFWFKSREGIQSRSNFAYIGQSPAVSLPWVQLQASDQKFSCTSLDNQRIEPFQDHFKKEEFKLLATEESQSHDMRVMESSWSESLPKPRRKKARKRDDSSESYRIVRKKKPSKVNDTKNITKNFSKAIISFILNNPELTCKHMTQREYTEFTQMLSSRKNQMTNIKQLRDLWVEDSEKPNFNRVFRIMRYYNAKLVITSSEDSLWLTSTIPGSRILFGISNTAIICYALLIHLMILNILKLFEIMDQLSQLQKLIAIENPTLDQVCEIMTCQTSDIPEILQKGPEFLRLVHIHQMTDIKQKIVSLREHYFQSDHRNYVLPEKHIKHLLCIGRYDEAINQLYQQGYIDSEEQTQLLSETNRLSYINSRPTHESTFMQSIYLVLRGYDPEIEDMADGNWRYLQMLQLQFNHIHPSRVKFESDVDHLLYKVTSNGFDLMKEILKLNQPTLAYATFILFQKEPLFRYLLPSTLNNMKRSLLYELLQAFQLNGQTLYSMGIIIQDFLKGSRKYGPQSETQYNFDKVEYDPYRLQITVDEAPVLLEKWFKQQLNSRPDRDYVILDFIVSQQSELTYLLTQKHGSNQGKIVDSYDRILLHSFQHAIKDMDSSKHIWPNILNKYINIGNLFLKKQVKRYISSLIDKQQIEKYQIDILIEYLSTQQTFKKQFSIIALKCQNVDMIKKYPITYYKNTLGDSRLANIIVKLIAPGFVKFLQTLNQAESNQYKSLLSVICESCDDANLEKKKDSLRRLIVQL